MKLIKTSKIAFVIIECYSTSEDISQTFQFTIQANDFDMLNDKEILYKIDNMSFGYDFDEMTIKIIEYNGCNGQFIEREISQ